MLSPVNTQQLPKQRCDFVLYEFKVYDAGGKYQLLNLKNDIEALYRRVNNPTFKTHVMTL